VTDIPAARMERIRALVNASGVVSLRKAKAELGVSEMTVRRDFAALEELGIVRRTRGGVIAVGGLVLDRPYEERQGLEIEAKEAIGLVAVSLIEPGDTIFLSGGTTCLALARALTTHQRLTVITNSVQALSVLMSNPALSVIATGGVADARDSDMTGPIAEATLRSFRANKAFVGASGMTPDGIFNASLARASTDRLMIEGAIEAYVLADRTKIGRASLAIVTELQQLSAVVTDVQPETEHAAWLSVAGINIVSVDASADRAASV
jgi:DeoR/GlpR family transcriptional regulator of sugar metabolism